jgi:hypothetical protein
MARVERYRGSHRIIAEAPAELELLADAKQRGHELVLLEGYYAIRDNAVLLPQGISVRAARRVCAALEEAAAAHLEAKRRRAGFQLIKP